MDRQKFEEFISQYPIYEYRLLDTQNIRIEENVEFSLEDDYTI